MGLGKTYEGIAIDVLNRAGDGNDKVDLATLFPKGKGMKTLVISPKSVVGSWEQHLEDLTDEDVRVVDTKNRHLMLKALKDQRTSGYFIVTWEFVRIEVKELQRIRFLNIIADEVHRAKNRKSAQTTALWKLDTIYKTGLSGTPADNAPWDLWAILHWLWPNFYTSYQQFVSAYALKEIDENTGYSKLVGVNEDTIGRLHEQMKNWFVRRLKSEVLDELPDKYYSTRWVDLHPKQRKAYDEMRKTMIAWASQYTDEELQSPIIANAVVSQLIRLQQYSDGYLIPRLDENGQHMYKWKWVYDKKWTYQKKMAWKQLYAPTKDEPLRPLDGGAKQIFLYDMIDPSSKLDALMELLEDRGDQPVIVFSQFKQVINLLRDRLEKKHILYGYLTGDVPQEDRTRFVQDFQAGKSRVFCGTIAAGGVGITLTAASTVVFLDRAWSPSANAQAEDRAHRIGQQEAVEIIDLMARNTVDLGRAQKIQLKKKWLDIILGDQVPQRTISLEEGAEVFEPETTEGDEE